MPDSLEMEAQEESQLREGLASGALFDQEKADALTSSEEDVSQPTAKNNQDKATETKDPLKKEVKKEVKKVERKSVATSDKNGKQDKVEKNGKLNGNAATPELDADGQPVSRGEKRLNEVRLKLDQDKQKFNVERQTYVSPQAQAEIDRLSLELANHKSQSEFTPEKLRLWADQELDSAAMAKDDETRLKHKQAASQMRKKADDLEKNLKEAEGTKAQVAQRTEAQKRQFNQSWDENLKKAIEEYPELGQPGSNIHSKASELMNHPDPYWQKALKGSPSGISTIAYIAHLQTEAEAASDLREELNELKGKLKGSLKKLGLGRGGITTQAPEKEFDDMSEAEQEAWLRRGLKQGLPL